MAETVGIISRDEEAIQNNIDHEDPFLNHDVMTSSVYSASPSLSSLNEEKGSSAVPERLSTLSSKTVAEAKALTGPKVFSGGQAQRTASGLAEHHPTVVNMLSGDSPYTVIVGNLQPVSITSLCFKSPCCDGSPSSVVPQVPRVPDEADESTGTVTALPGTDPKGCHTQQAGSSPMGNPVPCGLGQVIWMKTTKVMETLENKKKEEKEKYRLQLAMYRRLLLLRSIRSLHKQLEQQQARLQECYGTVINTKKEVLKHIRSTPSSSSP
ncbi:uncharacterized protein LOC133625285 [Colius striatus]|uniref:uncharacterized protein LOC133625285 n=1 Tax=Colius striatus TaxID=57412 RepID=UPI002B1E4D1A|nr:uncharacterized protein LOC133625285 [Colius striatus]